MTGVEYLQKHFHNGVAPKNVNISDHFALGCKLIIEGYEEAGIKMIRGSFALINQFCKIEKGSKDTTAIKSGFTVVSKNAEEAMIKFARESPAEAFHAVKAHNEMLKIVPAPKAKKK